MAPKGLVIGSVMLLLAMVLGGAMAQSGCTSAILSMASCLNYVSGSANAPSTQCCSSLANVVKTQPQCLCVIVNGGGGSFGVSINQTRALDLPRVCKVVTPPASRCNGVNGPAPAMSPVDSPQSAPPKSGNGFPGSETGSSRTTPSNGSESNGSIATINLQLAIAAIFLIITASFAPTFNNVF